MLGGFESEDSETKGSCASQRGPELRGTAQTPGAMVSDTLSLKCPQNRAETFSLQGPEQRRQLPPAGARTPQGGQAAGRLHKDPRGHIREAECSMPWKGRGQVKRASSQDGGQ